MMPRRPWDRARESYRNGKKKGTKRPKNPHRRKWATVNRPKSKKKKSKKNCAKKTKKREKYSDIHKEEMQSW